MSGRRRFEGVFLCLAWLAVWSMDLASTAPVSQADEAKPPATSGVDKNEALEKGVTQGSLRIAQPDGGVVECPLRHTDVQANVSGFIARVRVTQTFHNPTKEKIEAVYVFPLPSEAAVDDMTMSIGERQIVGIIKRRSEARSIYEQALMAGQTAALLEQERPNIFTQSVGNIEPGQEVRIQISYVDVLRYDLGNYEFRFPMVVGPRYIPGTPSGSAVPTPPALAGRVSPPVADTDRVPDASRISPPVMKPGVRNGHDISLALTIDAGVPIQDLKSTNHEAKMSRSGDRRAAIELLPADSLPNKDFVLRYAVVGKRPAMAMLAHTGDYSGDRQQLGNGYFMLMIQPQEDERLLKSPPREIVFLVDVSGSMSGEPTAKVIDTMQGMLKLCRPEDTLQLVTFASQARSLFDAPVPVTKENIAKALGFTSELAGGGGTEMLKGVQLAIDQPLDSKRMRIVVMLTDGYIGNEAEIIEHVGKHCGDQIRFWCVGIGSSPNMFLVDGVARQGGGMGKQLGLRDESQPLAQEIMTRIQRAQLAKVAIDWGNLQVAETYPAKVPDLWAGRPVIVYGRYAGGGTVTKDGWQAQLKVSGNIEGEPVSWPLTVELPKTEPQHDVLAKVWARHKIEDLMHQSFYQGSPAVEESVTALALDYRLMSQYTSFVAVDARQVDTTEQPRPPRRMLVPVPLPAGTQWEGFFGAEMSEGKNVDFLSLDVSFDGGLMESARPQLGGFDRRRNAVKGIAADSYRFAAPALANPTPTSPTPAAGKAFYALSPTTLSGGSTRGKQLADRSSRTSSLGRQAGASRESRTSSPRRYLSLELRELADQTQPAIKRLSQLEKELDHPSKDSVAVGYTVRALTAGGSALAATALQAFEQATGKEAPQDRDLLRQKLTRACLLDSAAANLALSDGSVADLAIDKLAELHQADVKEWSGRIAGLNTKLDLVLRDVPLSEAIRQVAGAAQLNIRLLEGSTEDAAALVPTQTAPRVSYLDLRHATVAQALDWILLPQRLIWWVDQTAAIAGSVRRQPAESGWVYDVRRIAIPQPTELKADGDEAKSAAAAVRIANEFIAAVRKSLGADDQAVLWFAPGQLLVFGSPERHTAAASLIRTLESRGERLDALPAALVQATRQRFAASQELAAKSSDAAQRIEVAWTHEKCSWQLLSAAAAGKVDLEALTELQIAWKSPQTTTLLSGESRPLVLRSLWTICQSSRHLPENRELAALATSALQQAKSAADAALADLEKDRSNLSAAASVIYFGLADGTVAGYGAKAAALLADDKSDNPGLQRLRLLGRILLAPPTDADRQAVEPLLRQGIGGPDGVALLALACRRLGGPMWEKFRGEARDLVGGQPLPGELVVLLQHWNRPQ